MTLLAESAPIRVSPSGAYQSRAELHKMFSRGEFLTALLLIIPAIWVDNISLGK